uniref:Uncharacterized protein n=1 Tax=Cacopsylla melanoneura TaxID=428564 RepID=A0A8D8YKD9_9HEMI
MSMINKNINWDILDFRDILWAGHVVRRDEESHLKQAWLFKPEGRRPRDNPKKSWWDQVQSDMEEINLTIEEAQVRWRLISIIFLLYFFYYFFTQPRFLVILKNFPK